MELTSDLLVSAGVGLIVLLAAINKYLTTLKGKSGEPGPQVAHSVGIELGNREQIEAMIAQLKRIGDILESKQQTAMDRKLDELLKRVDKPD